MYDKQNLVTDGSPPGQVAFTVYALGGTATGVDMTHSLGTEPAPMTGRMRYGNGVIYRDEGPRVGVVHVAY